MSEDSIKNDGVNKNSKVNWVYALCFIATFFLATFLWLFYADSAGLLSLTKMMIAVTVTFPPMIVSIVLIGVRLKLIVGSDVKSSEGIAINALAQLVGLIIPSRLSELAKPIGLNLLCGTPPGRGLAALAIERLLDAFMLGAIAAVAAMAGPWRGSMLSSALMLVMVASVAVGLLCLTFMYPNLLDACVNRLPSMWLREQARGAVEAIRVVRNRRFLALSGLLSTAAWLLAYLVFVCFFIATGYFDIGLSGVLVVFVASTLGLIVAIAPGGLGTFEAAIVLSLAAYDIPPDEALTLAVLMRLCLVLPVVAAAAWVMLTSKISLAKVLQQLTTRRTRL